MINSINIVLRNLCRAAGPGLVLIGSALPMALSVDPGFTPFNIVNIDGLLPATYPKQEAPRLEDDEPDPGDGFVDIFDLEGHRLRRFASHAPLNSPWGVALAPRHFGLFSNALPIGNFGDGRINAF